LELDNTGDIISYEEYHPFGTTSYRSGRTEIEVSLKRYKYQGKERDDETGFYYYGMRYYAAWLCRFVSIDPLQFKYPHYTPYQYAGNKPVTFIDLDGEEESDIKKDEKQQNGIILINKSTGKYLETYTSETISGYSIRAIAGWEYDDLKQDNMLNEKNILDASVEVTIDIEKISADIAKLEKGLIRTVYEENVPIEQSLFIGFDMTNNLITSVFLPSEKNTNNETESGNYVLTSSGTPVYRNNTNFIILASMHTHEDKPSKRNNTISSIQQMSFKESILQGGVSDADINFSKNTLNNAPVFALINYSNKLKGNIYTTSGIVSENDDKNKQPVTTYNKVMSNIKRFIQDVIFSNR
jgi:RHS repeat-associated protein